VAQGPQVLVVDDDPAILIYLHRKLVAEGYEVRELSSGSKFLDDLADKTPDLLIIGLDLVKDGGAKLIRRVRKISNIPIVALSARVDESSLVEAFESGADDYVRKPFGIFELLARVHGVLRRAVRERGVPPTFISGDLEVNLVRRRVRCRGKELHLPVKSYEVLRVLVEGADRVLTYEAILRAVWGRRRADRVPYVRLAVRQIRRLIEVDPANPAYIVTEARVGYRLCVLKPTTRQSDH
jgi:two-component system, OmpR family, KDP operon response regulator KdpE